RTKTYASVLRKKSQRLFPQPSHLELSQHMGQVLDMSSHFGGCDSTWNLVGPPNIFSLDEDFTHVAVPRTCGSWRDRLSRWTHGRCPKNPEWFKSQNFIVLLFDVPVFPTRVKVLGMYQPGCMVRILAKSWDEGEDSAVCRWRTLWSGPADPNLPPNVFYEFSPPIHPPGFATNVLRLEFSCSLNAYCLELVDVVLYGIPVDIMQPKKSKNEDLAESERLRQRQNTMERSRRRDMVEHMEEERRVDEEEEKLSPFTNNGYFDLLPFEIIEIILSHLTLPELCCLAQCSRTLRTLRNYCYNPSMYKHLDLKPFWPSLCEQDLLALKPRLTCARSLGLSWTGNDGRFSTTWSEHLLHLELANCHWITNKSLESVTMLCPNLRDLDLSSCHRIPPRKFRQLSSLQRLQRLVLYRTRIDVSCLCRLCAFTLFLASNCQQLRSLNMWGSIGLTEVGLAHLTSRCKDIEVLDLGWCTNVWTESGVLSDMLRELPRLRRLVLTGNLSISDTDLEPLANHCPLLEQLDILGAPLVTHGGIFHLLDTCRHMCFLDVSFCFRVDEEMAFQLANRFPHICIKYSS
uniref:F-box and leucine-rich repeat protein 4 n=1 Tax=Eptatretus burgeri TaxID=7764 RepID=A0A8C4QCT6_EPTBU